MTGLRKPCAPIWRLSFEQTRTEPAGFDPGPPAQPGTSQRQIFERTLAILCNRTFPLPAVPIGTCRSIRSQGSPAVSSLGPSILPPDGDIDLLGQTSNEVENLVEIVREVCGQDVQEDGLLFDPATVTGERIKEDADYKGVRVRFSGLLGKARVHLQIDVGFADVVSPAPMVKIYPVILPMPAPELRSYPPETVVAEKAQAMVFLGSVNSRMKDFYDIWILAGEFEFKGAELQEAIRLTFKHRDTDIPSGEPVAFSTQFAQDKRNQWRAFLKTSAIADAPDPFDIILMRLKEFIIPVFESTHTGQRFEKTWKGCGPWR